MDILKISKRARDAMAMLTDLPIDAITLCEPDGEGWRAVIEVVESRARIGDDDLLTSYELELDAGGQLQKYRRIGRRRRFDSASSAA